MFAWGIGEKQFGGGRMGEKGSTGITEQLVSYGFESDRLKTGTPPRIDGRSLDYSKMEVQQGDEDIVGFSYLNTKKPNKQRNCWITYTNQNVHDILKTGFEKSPMFQGRIQGIGPRYCPSIEDKIKYLIENHLINIDVDMMENKKLDSDNIVKKLMDIWKDDPINSFKSLLRNLDNDYVEFDNNTQKLINNSFANSVKDKINAIVELKDSDDELQELPSGKEKIKTSSEENDELLSESDSEEEKEITKISFTKEVLLMKNSSLSTILSKEMHTD